MLSLRLLILGVALSVAFGLPAAAQAVPDILARLAGAETSLTVAGRTVDPAPLRAFYATRKGVPAWSEATAKSVLDAMPTIAAGEGLAPDVYGVPAEAAGPDRDILVSDAVARFGRDLARGRLTPRKTLGGMGPETRPDFDAGAFLAEVAAGKRLDALAEALPPPYAGYQRLKAALEKLRAVVKAGGWPVVPDGPSLKPGAEGERVLALRKRLVATNDLAAAQDKGKAYDKVVTEAVRRFQARHGIDPDGAVGKQTLAALNVPAETRLAQVEANLERWRWMPRALDSTHIAVNIPAAHFELVREGRIELSMRVVVGDLQHPTPPMMTTLGSVVLNPTWTVPPTIATKEILPKLKKDPNYLRANNMVILDAFAGEPDKARGLGIDWSRMHRFPWRLRQRPGEDNALGQIKFNLTNSDDIYLHDTPKRQYFDRIFRALSHGCVRLERPADLARAVLPREIGDKVDELIAGDDTKTVRLEKPITVYLMYMTAWADEDGTTHYRDDIYEHDKRLAEVLRRTARIGSIPDSKG